MADELITKQELIDAKPDVKNLGEAANGNETGIVTPRYGAPYSTAPAAIQKIQIDGANAIQAFQNSGNATIQSFQTEANEAISKMENTGGLISAPTLTALQAITPEYDYQLARVDATGDEYRWNPALTTTVKWEPTGRNFLSESKSYTDESIAQNLLFDPFNETVKSDFTDNLQSVRSAEFNTLTTQQASPFINKPVLRANNNLQSRRYIDTSKLALKIGDKFYVRIMSYFVNATTSNVSAYLRKSDNSIIQQISTAPDVGLNDHVLGPFTVSETPDHLLIAIAGQDTKDLIAIAVSFNKQPKFVYGSIAAKFNRDISNDVINLQNRMSETELTDATNIRNIATDPFFRLYNADIKTVDGYPWLDDPTTMWSIVNYSASPFPNKYALFVNSTGSKTKTMKFSRLGVKVGDTLTFKAGIISKSNVNFVIAGYIRNSANTVIGSTASTAKDLVADVYSEIYHTIIITQAMIDAGAIFQLRLNVDGKSVAGGWYCCGIAVHVNNPSAQIRDTTSNMEDDLRVLIKNSAVVQLPVPHTFGEYYLRETRQRSRKRLLGESKQLSVASIGDSWTHNRDRWCFPVAQTLMSQLGDAGGGWTGFANHPAVTALINGNVRPTYTMTKTEDWGSVYATAASPDSCYVTSSIAGSKITCTTPASPNINGCDLFFMGTSSGVIRYRFNGGTWNNINLNSVPISNVGIQALTGFGSGAQTLEIETVSGTCNLAGLNWKSSSDGVVWHKLAASGSSAQQWSNLNATQWGIGLLGLAPNLVTIMHGTNDQTSGTSAANFALYISKIIDNIRSVLPLTDVLVIMPCENNRTNNTVAMSDYTSAVYEVCKTKKCAFLDLQKVFGDNPSEYAYTSARNWFASDLIHPEPNTGGRAITDAVMRFLLD